MRDRRGSKNVRMLTTPLPHSPVHHVQCMWIIWLNTLPSNRRMRCTASWAIDAPSFKVVSYDYDFVNIFVVPEEYLWFLTLPDAHYQTSVMVRGLELLLIPTLEGNSFKWKPFLHLALCKQRTQTMFSIQYNSFLVQCASASLK